MSNGGSHRHSAERGDNFRHKEKKRSIEIGKQAAEASRGPLHTFFDEIYA